MKYSRKIRGRRSTPAGQHQPVMLQEVLAVLDPQPGEIVADCTVGWTGHAVQLLRRVGPNGRLIGMDLDNDNLPRAHERLAAVGENFSLVQANFAGLPAALATLGVSAVDVLFADLGMSSMQVDDPERGFSYVRDGPLDMRMDRSRGRTAAQLLASMTEGELAQALRDLGDEPQAERIARAVLAARERDPLVRTGQLAQQVLEATLEDRGGRPWQLHPATRRWDLHPAARTFQALRILVNRELNNLEALLRAIPQCLRPGGRAAILTFHSGEDRLVKAAFRQGQYAGTYRETAAEPQRASPEERLANPRSRSAKLRWAICP